MSSKKLLTQKGEVYISAIIALGLFLILSQAVISLVTSAYNLVSYNRAKTNARQIATEQVEIIKNLTYDQVGTVGGIPAGIIPQTEKRFLNSLEYTVSTQVVYVDDPFDSVAPNDATPTDYKKVRVDISWGGTAPSRSNTTTIITDIAPRSLETAVEGGTLTISVLNASGEPVPQADVTIIADTVSPVVNIQSQTDNNGRITLPGAGVCNECYEITVTKEDYSSERTYSSTEIANPIKPHVSIIESEVTEISFVVDRYSKLNLKTLSGPEANYSTLGSQIVHIRGNKILGTTQQDQPVYKFDEQVVTNSSGNLTIEEFEFDTYDISLLSNTTRTIAAANPLIPLVVVPNTEINFQLALAPLNSHTLRLIIKDPTQTLIATASARISRQGFESSAVTGTQDTVNYGQAFFNSLINQTYTIEATASGFQNYSENINLSGNVTKTIIMQNE